VALHEEVFGVKSEMQVETIVEYAWDSSLTTEPTRALLRFQRSEKGS
jgi:hypothetical protein